jgi:hypothetical protein
MVDIAKISILTVQNNDECLLERWTLFFVSKFMEKICCTCKVFKNSSQFAVKNSNPDHLQDRCRECWKLWRRKHYLKHKVDFLIRCRKYREKRKYDINNLIAQMYVRMRQRTVEFKYLSLCSKDYFVSVALNDSQLLNIYNHWIDGGFVRDDTPTVDRIDCFRGYEEGNIQFLTFRKNYLKGVTEGKLKAVSHITHP